MTLLTAVDLHLWRGERHVLRGVSFAADAGQCVQVGGANGAGKTSLLRALCGLLPLAGGDVRWRDVELRRDPAALHRESAYAGHQLGLKAELSALENLQFLCGLRGRSSGQELSAALSRVGLDGELQQRQLRELSAGQQRRVALARVIAQGATLWLLDEPAANLDVQGQALLHQALAEHLRAGGVGVVATHQPLNLPDSALLPLELAA
jgi:heme exporter protein A